MARTGFDSWFWTLIAVGLIIGGIGFVVSTINQDISRKNKG